MAQILTFLGKDNQERTTIAIAAAKRLARQGKRVLFATQDSSPAVGLMLNAMLTPDPTQYDSNLDVVQLLATVLLERSWEDIKKLESQYLRTPFFTTEVYGQELSILPGMDTALVLNALREYDASDRYDVIVFDGSGDQTTIRMLGMPEVLSWYMRRFRQVFADSDLGKTVVPLLQPIVLAVSNISWTGDIFDQPATRQVNNVLEEGQAAVADPNRVAAYLVTATDDIAIATTQYLWGSAQQAGLSVGGVILYPASTDSNLIEQFAPLPVTSVLAQPGNDWQPLMDALPDFDTAAQMPRPLAVNVAERKISLFLPGFDRKQVKLTQYGGGLTIEAGDQRRNILLPSELQGKSVSGAKFQDGFLIISF